MMPLWSSREDSRVHEFAAFGRGSPSYRLQHGARQLRLRTAVVRSPAGGGWLSACTSWFPDREFFMRFNGHVRFIRLSAQFQMRMAGAVAGAVLLWAVMMGWMVLAQAWLHMAMPRCWSAKLLSQRLKAEFAQYRSGLGEVARDLRQAAGIYRKKCAGCDWPDAGFASLRHRSIAVMKPPRRCGGFPDTAAKRRSPRLKPGNLPLSRSSRAMPMPVRPAQTSAIRRLGLNPGTIATGDRRAMGGPLIPMLYRPAIILIRGLPALAPPGPDERDGTCPRCAFRIRCPPA